MKTHNISLINAILLITLAAWGYLDSDTPSVTALIPAFFGIGLIICNPGLKKENKVAAHIAVLFTLLIILGLFQPFMGVVKRESTIGIVRVSLMLVSSIIAFCYFIKSFIEARKKRAIGS